MDTQDLQDETLWHGLQPISCKLLNIIDLIRISWLQFPHYIPLFKQESTGPFRTLADGNRSAKPCSPNAVRGRRSEQN